LLIQSLGEDKSYYFLQQISSSENKEMQFSSPSSSFLPLEHPHALYTFCVPVPEPPALSLYWCPLYIHSNPRQHL